MKKILLIISLLIPFLSYAEDIFGMSEKSNHQLMEMYWKCDVISEQIINQGARADDVSMAVCNVVSTEVRKRFFNDDFVSYLKWVKDNKSKKTLPF